MIETLATAIQPYWALDWGAAFLSLLAMNTIARKYKSNKVDITQ